MKSNNRSYDSNFKREALELILSSDKNVSQIAKDLGIPSGTLHGWIRSQEKHGPNAFPGHGKPRDEELHLLKKENAELKMERDILKKALAIFSKVQK